MRVRKEAGCEMTEIFRAVCEMKIGRRDQDMLCFVGGIGDGTSIGGIIIKLNVRVTVFSCVINGLD